MNKYLLGTAAIAGLLLASAPAQAQMELTIGGHSKNYVGYLDQDVAAGSADVSEFDMQRETELHFNGESTLDNGLTFGFQVEAEVDAGDDANTIEESYIYLSGTWGRINLGSEDGAAYLLQVAAPSADSNIDGIRQTIQPVNYSNAFGVPTVQTVPATPGLVTLAGSSTAFSVPSGSSDVDGFDYDNDLTGKAEKITYLTPNYNGLQLGASYTHDVNDTNSVANNLTGFNSDAGADDAMEVAARYEGVFSNFGYALGAGYTDLSNDSDEWNVGLDVDTGPFGIGAIYTEFDNGAGSDSETIVVGADYTSGPFKFGASYFTEEDETNVGGTATLDTDRYTGGVIYTAGPGLTFRGSVSYIDHEVAGGADVDATSVLGGVQINF